MFFWSPLLDTVVTRHYIVDMVVTASQYLTQEKESVSSLALVRNVEIVRYVGTNTSRLWLATLLLT